MDPKDKKGDNNQKKRAQLLTMIDEVLGRVLQKGYFGQATFAILIQDGVIQEIEKKESEKHR